jgi:hypothetical protein
MNELHIALRAQFGQSLNFAALQEKAAGSAAFLVSEG